MTTPISLASTHQSAAFASTKALQNRHAKGSGAVQFSLPSAPPAATPAVPTTAAASGANHGNLVNGSLLATLAAQNQQK
ncbi:MAG TPA: hypothetical protein VM689_07535 [Aliidongia sp.]|nr:hypothetical protein [Aliidongia sp.]